MNGLKRKPSMTKAEFKTTPKRRLKSAQRAGIIDGMDEYNFAPRDYATRAQVATIITRFHQSFVK